MFFFNINTALADIAVKEYTYSWDSEQADIPLQKISENCYIFNCDGIDYIYSELSDTSPIKYNKDEADFFIKQFNGLYYCHDYLWTGEYYMARFHRTDSIPQSYSGYSSFPVRLYDKNYNLVKEYNFNKYVYKIVYIHNTYYCLVGNQWMFSNDFENWENSEDIISCKTNNIEYINNSISINGNAFCNVIYENNTSPNIYRAIGDYILGNRSGEQLISLDNIYFIRVPIGIKKLSGVYFKDDNLVYEGASKYFGSSEKSRVYVSKIDIDNKLQKLKNSPYVKYNNKILAFEVPPVIQDDRTLIPIRFLFEQMGAEVDWNDETQTATVTQNNTAIAFAINEADADINGQTVTMDVPAQLINGKTMVPVRFLSENLGYTVEWDDENRIITIE